MFRYCYTFEGKDMDKVIPPVLKPGEKIHYCIFHDETCIHANDQCTCVWQREGEQPLRDKSRGRINHISDYIIEHCGRLCLSPEEIKVQMSLPEEPLPPGSSVPPDPVVPIPGTITTPNPPPAAPKKTRAKKNTENTPKPAPGRRTLAKPNGWVPPPPPVPFTSYRIPSFDARRIIYPGANHDPWWDMPQLIAQVSTRFMTMKFWWLTETPRPKMPSRFLMSSTPMELPYSFLTVRQLTKHMQKMH